MNKYLVTVRYSEVPARATYPVEAEDAESARVAIEKQLSRERWKNFEILGITEVHNEK